MGSATRPLSALLSQVLVAFTVEFDNEFERRMGEAGYRGARLSLIVWTNLMRFAGDVSVRDLAAQALAPETHVKFQLGCLERWGFVVLQQAAGAHPPSGGKPRAGWGSGRGIRMDWLVRLTSKGIAASRIWPPLFGEIEQRWDRRFGQDAIGRLRGALQAIVDQIDVDLPDGLPARWEERVEFPLRVKRGHENLPLAALLSRVLLAFRIEFDSESLTPLIFCANVLRVLGAEPVRSTELSRLTGSSPETSDIGWQMKPYVVVTSDPAARRGKVVDLSQRGLIAQQTYHRLVRTIEQRWQEKFGKGAIVDLRESLEGLFDRLSEGLVPPAGAARAGDQAPALGRRDVGPAARQRMRDLVAQTEAFVRDPAGALPHYPSWDMNRGFGP